MSVFILLLALGAAGAVSAALGLFFLAMREPESYDNDDNDCCF